MPITGFSERIAVVTGAAGSMGRHLTRALLEQGALVAGLDRPSAAGVLAEIRNEYPETFRAIEVDIAQQPSVAHAFTQVDVEFGPVQHLVNFAGLTPPAASVLDTTPEDVASVLSVNFAGTVWACEEALRRMIPQKDGAIVNISSANGIAARRYDWTHIYAGAKAAVIGFSRSVAAEAAASDVRINCIAPGMHLSPMQEDMGVGAADFRKRAVDFTPLHRPGTGPDMIGPVLFLLGPDSGFITGQVLVSDGGRSMWYE